MRDLMVAVDLSGSMEAQDFTDNEGNSVDRLTAVKQVLDEFFARRDGDRVGLILFGSAAFVQVPFTDDLDVVRELLNEAQIRMLGPKTMLGDAMGLAINLFERSEVDERVLVVLTDGNDTGSLVPPERAGVGEIVGGSGFPRQVETQSYRPLTELYDWPVAAFMLISLLYIMFLEIRLHILNRQMDEATVQEAAN